MHLAGHSAAVFSLLEDCLVKVALPPEAQKQYASGNIAKSFLEPYAKAISLLSQGYLEKASQTIATISDPKQADAYALYYTPINFAKILKLFGELPASFTNQPLKILDYGCGPGTASLAAISTFANELEIHAFDKSRAMLSSAVKIEREFQSLFGARFGAAKKRCHWRAFNSEAELASDYQLIIAANVINEIPAASQMQLITGLANRLADDGVYVLLEPALQNTTRQLMGLRDALIERDASLVPIFPCTRSDSCPMLKQSKQDWCHGTLYESDALWGNSKLVKQLDAITGFNKHRVKYAAFIFQKHGVLRDGYRVITPSTKTNRGVTAKICGKSIYGDALLTKNAKSENNASFQKLKDYDRVLIDNLDDSLMIKTDSMVALV